MGRWLQSLGIGTLVLIAPGAAFAGLDYQPSTSRRMAVSDRSSELGLQPRVWVVTHDGWLTSKIPEVNDYGWTLHACCVDSGVDAVSWTVGSVVHQRVFFAREGKIQTMNWDSDHYNSWGPLPSPAAGIEFDNTDVAALSWTESGTQRVGVAAVSTDGRLCTWRGDTAGFSAPVCTSASWAKTTDVDVVGTVVNGAPLFAYRHAGGGIAVTRPFLTSWYSSLLGAPADAPVRPSLALHPRIGTTNQAELLVIGNSGQLHAARFVATSNSETWTALPTLPAGAQPTSEPNALAATSYTQFSWPSSSTIHNAIYVASTSRRLYRAYSDSAGNVSGWTAGSAGYAASPPDEAWYGNGVAYASGLFSFSSPTLFGTGGTYALIAARYTTQQFLEPSFRDHIHFSHVDHDIVLGSVPGGTQPANESTASLRSVVGISSAIRRNSDGRPWEVAVSDSFTGGHDWSNDFVVRTAAGWPNPSALAGATDPFTAIDSSGRFHLLTLEVPLTYPVATDPFCEAPGTRRMVYRNGSSASQLANTTAIGTRLRIVDEGNLDHGNLAVTEDAAGTTAHAVYWNIGLASVMHWWRTPAGVENMVSLSPTLPQGPAGVFAGAGNELFAYRFTGMGGAVTLCRLGTSGACDGSAFVVGAGTSPSPIFPDISFGPAAPLDPKATCGGRRCFDTAQPYGFATHPLIPRQIYTVFQGADPAGGASVYFQKNDGSSLGVWSTPIRVHARGFGDTTHFVDPSITVDKEGTLVVTYTRADTSATSFSQYAAYSTDGGTSWSVLRLPVTWRPDDLPFHCKRKKFFPGEYREGATVGNRAFQHLHRSSGGNTVLTSYWASRWSMNGY
ncbi:MAG: hypothetical protein R3B13_17975 [Polyangiaceae bacterium]